MNAASVLCRRLAVAALVLAAGCAPAVRHLPSGAGEPAPDGSATVAQATRTCRDVHAITAEIAVSGKVAGRRLRGRLLAGVAAPDSLRLEAEAPFGQPIFVLVAHGGRGTLLLPRDGRVLTDAQPAAVMDALAGVSLSPADLLAILSGCGVEPPPAGDFTAFGRDWLRASGPASAAVYLHRGDDAWRVVAAEKPQPDGRTLRVDYSDFSQDRPASIRLVIPPPAARASEGGAPGAVKPVDLTLRLSQVDINTRLGAEAFEVKIPDGATPMTLDELKANGLLGGAR